MSFSTSNIPSAASSGVSAKVNDTGLASASNAAATDTSASSTRKTDKNMGKEDFLQLLITQLRYQDPLSPMDNTQFVAQLAQFQSLEGTTNIQKAIEELGSSYKDSVSAQAASADSLASTAAISLIGKSVRMQVNSLDWSAGAGEKLEIPVYLGGNDQATVEIKDGSGTVVKTMTASGKDSENSVLLTWDGQTDKGDVAPAGSYTVHIVGQEKDSSLYAFIEDTVTGVRFSGATTLVKIHGTELPLSNILDVASGGSQSQGQVLSQGSAVALIGKNVRVRQTAVTFNQASGNGVDIKVNAPRNAPVRITLFDAAGNSVQTLSGVADDKGVATFAWDGANNAGGYAATGQYTVRVAGETQDPSLYSFIEGRVEGVSNLPGSATVRVDGVSFDLSDIVDISETSAQEA